MDYSKMKKSQLIEEIEALQEKVVELERAETDRKRAEEALRESEEKYRALVENSPNLVAIYQEGSLKYVNKAMCERLGWTFEEMTSASFSPIEKIIPQRLQSQIRENIAKRLRGENIPPYEISIKARDGSEIPVIVKAQAILYRGKLADEVIHTDITERKRAEEALRESQQLLERTFASLLDAVFIIDADTVEIMDCNPAASEIFGYSSQEMLGRTTAFLHIDQAALEEFRQHLYPAVEEKGFLFLPEFRMKRKDGTVFPTEHSVMPLEDEQGKRIGWVSVIRDITDRKRAEDALRHSLEETARGQRTLLALSQAAQAVQRAHTPDEVYRTVGDEVARLGYHAAVFTVTDDREHLSITYMTFQPALLRTLEKLTGLSVQTFRLPLAQTIVFKRVLTEGGSSFDEPAADFMAGGLPEPVRPLAGRIASMLGLEQCITAPLTVGDETYGLLHVTGRGLTEADVPAMTAFANQAAIAIENARLYEQVQAAREQLRDLAGYLQNAREEERTQIAREIHDEFGQALSALNMDLSWLSKRLPADQPYLAEKASAMSDLIDSTIQTVRRVATELRPGLLDELGLAATIEWQAQEFAERTGIDCDLYLSDEEIVLDRDLATAIFRIFQETLTNVARHAQATQVRVELEDRPDELVLIVRDNGKGITESQVSHPRSLGLMGMRERARSWGGEVAFQGVAGQGTTVTVRVPNVEFGMRNSESSQPNVECGIRNAE